MDNIWAVKIDIKTGIIGEPIYKENNARTSVMQILLSDNGMVKDVTSQNIVFNFKRADGGLTKQDLSKVDDGVSVINAMVGSFQVKLDVNALAYPGLVKCDIDFTLGEDLLSTPTFQFMVSASIGQLRINYISEIETKITDWKTKVDAIMASGATGIAPDNSITDDQLKDTGIKATVAQNTSDIAENVASLANMSAQLPLKAPQSQLDTANINLNKAMTDIIVNNEKIANNTSAIISIASGSPKGVYVALSNITADASAVKTNIYITSSDGNWNYWNGTAWVSGGLYQSTAIADKSIPPSKLDRLYVSGVKKPNIFDKSTVTNGYYVSYTTGVLMAVEDWSTSDYIDVAALSNYIESGYGSTIGQVALFNSSKTFVSGLLSSSQFVIPTGVAFARISVKTANISTTQFELGTVATNYGEYGVEGKPSTITNDMIISKSIKDDKLFSTYAKYIIGKNKFNKATATMGYYVNQGNGLLVANASWASSDFIEIDPLLGVMISGTGGQTAYYNQYKTWIGGSTTNILNNLPNNAKYIKTSIALATPTTINTVQVEQGTVVTQFEPYSFGINPSDIGRNPGFNFTKIISISMKADGSGEFLNMCKAIDYINSKGDNSAYTIYQIRAEEGIYDLFDGFTIEELTSTRGIELPNNAEIIGIGNKHKIVLKAEFADGVSDAIKINASGLNIMRGGTLRNLTVTGLNTRYAVHADTIASISDSEYLGIIEDCVFIYYGTNALYNGNPWGGNCWGSGNHSGSTRKFKNCDFIAYNGSNPFGLHSNIGFTKNTYTRFENCRFMSTKPTGLLSFRAISSGVINRVDFIGCTSNCFISLDITDGCDYDFDIQGYGNTILPHYDHTTENLYVDFREEVLHFANNTGATITMGTPVKLEGTTQVTPLINTDTSVLFSGVALEDIPTGTCGAIRYKGYMFLSKARVSASVGSKIGVVNGALAVVTTGDYVGIVDVNGFLKLI